MKRDVLKNSEKQATRLRNAIVSGNIFHAMIFSGKAAETREFAEWFTAAALCETVSGDPCGTCASCRKIKDENSGEIIRISPEDTGRIKDRQIEDVITRSIKNALGADRVFTVIENADSMTPRAQNRLLKTLEEPPAGVNIILLCENEQALLQTIRSRCQIIKLVDEKIELKETAKKAFLKRTAETASALLLGKPLYEIWKDLDYFASTRDYALKFSELLQLFIRDVIISGYSGCENIIYFKDYAEEIERCRGKLKEEQLLSIMDAARGACRDLEMNVSMKHAVRFMALDIQEVLAR